MQQHIPELELRERSDKEESSADKTVSSSLLD